MLLILFFSSPFLYPFFSLSLFTAENISFYAQSSILLSQLSLKLLSLNPAMQQCSHTLRYNPQKSLPISDRQKFVICFFLELSPSVITVPIHRFAKKLQLCSLEINANPTSQELLSPNHPFSSFPFVVIHLQRTTILSSKVPSSVIYLCDCLLGVCPPVNWKFVEVINKEITIIKVTSFNSFTSIIPLTQTSIPKFLLNIYLTKSRFFN